MTAIFVVGNNVGISSFFIHPDFTDSSGRPTGAVYGFVRRMRPLLQMIGEQRPGRLKATVLWDSGSNWRKEVLPSYKESRAAGREDGKLDGYFEQVQTLRDVLSVIGMHQLVAEGYEADDIAGWLCANVSGDVILVSDDKDWLQLVSDRVHVYQPRGQSIAGQNEERPSMYVTPENFKEVSKCDDTEEFVKMKAIMGDPGDDVPGASGVGEKTALDFLRGTLKATTAAGKPAKKFESVKSWMTDPDGYDRSLKLVDLRDIDIPIEQLRLVDGKLNEDVLFKYFVRLGFASILSKGESWFAPFRNLTA